MRNYLTLERLIILVLGVFLLLNTQCEKAEEPKVITKVETKWDTITKVTTEYVPQWSTRVEYRWDTVHTPLSIDTAMVINDYFAKYYYTDTLEVDTLGYVTISDTIHKNQLTSRTTLVDVRIPTKTVTNTIIQNKRELYWGIGLGTKTQEFNYLSGELLYRTKNKHAYGFGLGVDNNFQPIYSGRIYWKIGK